ncbi:hypothetical protein PoB_006216300 [Plakobranchus ocellatus]|uniref:Uncharacterized protein n=1 Tax=Plakobranchus ocellatus TaxID=259542 RepID=A0AAV4CUU8_9GAST|nr:hypothetical protein PoB_006216300 [Plakobranchus ocellatus]
MKARNRESRGPDCDGMWGVGSTVACESALRSAGTLLSRVRAPLPAPWPDGGPESLRSPCCGLAVYKKLKHTRDGMCLELVQNMLDVIWTYIQPVPYTGEYIQSADGQVR